MNLHDATQWAVLIIVALAAGGWTILSARSGSWLKSHARFLTSKQQDQILETEHTLYQAAADYLIKYVTATGDKIHPQMNNALEQFAVQMVLNHPSAVIGDPNVIAAQILAKIPSPLISTDTTGATIKTTTVTTETIPAPTGV